MKTVALAIAAMLTGCGASPEAEAILEPGMSWQYRLDGGIPSPADVVIVDLDVSADDVVDLVDAGAYPVCYLSLGTVEDWRDDASGFPDHVVGNPLPDWEGERYLDLRAIDDLAPIWEARLDECAAKGFRGIDPDNIDAYSNDSGFPLTESDALEALQWLADQAHERGLTIGLKNAPELVPAAVTFVDFAVVEQCATYRFCREFDPFVDAGKPVFDVEYREDGATLDSVCPIGRAHGISMVLANLDLDGDGDDC